MFTRSNSDSFPYSTAARAETALESPRSLSQIFFRSSSILVNAGSVNFSRVLSNILVKARVAIALTLSGICPTNDASLPLGITT